MLSNAPTMNFALSEDHLVLRQSARTFIEKEISLQRVLVPGTTVCQTCSPSLTPAG
jgi:hypothetical protein